MEEENTSGRRRKKCHKIIHCLFTVSSQLYLQIVKSDVHIINLRRWKSHGKLTRDAQSVSHFTGPFYL